MRLTVDAQDRVWFTEFLGNKIGVYDQSSKHLDEYVIPTNDSGPADLTFDKHGILWFTEAYARQVGRFDPQNQSFREYPLGSSTGAQYVASPVGIAVDEEEHVWFADHGGNWIGEFDPSTQQLILYPTHTPQPDQYPESIPNGILIDRQGRVWFTEHGGNSIAYFDTSNQTMVEFPIPTGPISTALWLALAPNGNVWFTEWTTNKIGVVDANQSVPISLQVSQNSLQLQTSQEKFLLLTITPAHGFSGNGTLRYSWSDYYPPRDLNVTFSTLNVSFADSSNASIQIQLSNSVLAGNYTLGLELATGNAFVSKMIQVNVMGTEAPSPMPSGNLLLDLAVALGAVVILTVSVVYWKKRSREEEIRSSTVSLT